MAQDDEGYRNMLQNQWRLQSKAFSLTVKIDKNLEREGEFGKTEKIGEEILTHDFDF